MSAFKFITALTFTLFTTSSFAANSNSELVQKYLNAFASRDAQGIFSLFNWDGIDSRERANLQRQIKHSFKGRQIRRIYIDPVSRDTQSSFSQNGMHYQLNLKPSGKLNIVYISNKGQRSTTQHFVGQHQGQLKIASITNTLTTADCSAKPTHHC